MVSYSVRSDHPVRSGLSPGWLYCQESYSWLRFLLLLGLTQRCSGITLLFFVHGSLQLGTEESVVLKGPYGIWELNLSWLRARQKSWPYYCSGPCLEFWGKDTPTPNPGLMVPLPGTTQGLQSLALAVQKQRAKDAYVQRFKYVSLITQLPLWPPCCHFNFFQDASWECTWEGLCLHLVSIFSISHTTVPPSVECSGARWAFLPSSFLHWVQLGTHFPRPHCLPVAFSTHPCLGLNLEGNIRGFWGARNSWERLGFGGFIELS